MAIQTENPAMWNNARGRFEDLLAGKCTERADDDHMRISRNIGVMEAAAVLSGLTDRARAGDNAPEVVALLSTIQQMVSDLVYK